ncbi:hypothetical protein PEC311524_20300 [Pectobacterium carotovorum subsp. carotovorum]|nr:hypothetical protein PEC311524_20300 [Pectobacterium carotovorum subsp. carotovorum]
MSSTFKVVVVQERVFSYLNLMVQSLSNGNSFLWIESLYPLANKIN